MHVSFLQMFLDNKLIEEVRLNYSGLHTAEEIGWYQQGTVQELCERHETLLRHAGAKPFFVIRNVAHTARTAF